MKLFKKKTVLLLLYLSNNKQSVCVEAVTKNKMNVDEIRAMFAKCARRGLTRRSTAQVRPTCKTCFNYMHRAEKYLQLSPFSYSEQFTARFPWDVKSNVFNPLLDSIESLAVQKQTFHHFIDDLKDLNIIFDLRYIPTQYSFSYTLEEYDYVINMLRYMYVFLDNDQDLARQIETLQLDLALEISRAKTGYFYRPCSCGSQCVTTKKFNKRIKNSKRYHCGDENLGGEEEKNS